MKIREYIQWLLPSHKWKVLAIIFLGMVVGGGALPCKFYDRPHNEELQPHRDAMEEKLITHLNEKDRKAYYENSSSEVA